MSVRFDRRIRSSNECASVQTVETIEDLALVSVQIATKFLFSIGWRTKKALRLVQPIAIALSERLCNF